MIYKQLSGEIVQRKLVISAAESLHFYSSITRFIKFGSRCSLGCMGRSYKLLRGYPPSPQVRKFNLPFSRWRGVLLFFYLQLFKTILFHFLMKVDGQVSRVNRDKYPVLL